jgi:hypothetical protein
VYISLGHVSDTMKHLNKFLFTMGAIATALATGLAWALIYLRG